MVKIVRALSILLLFTQSEATLATTFYFTKENAVYIIRDIIDLKNNTVKMPKGCTLKFDGGVITNGKIEFNDTKVLYNNSNTCFSNMLFSGVIKNDIVASSILPSNEIQAIFDVLHDSECTLVLNDNISLASSSKIPSINGEGKTIYIAKDISFENNKTLFLKDLTINDSFASFTIRHGEQSLGTNANSLFLINKTKGKLSVSNVTYASPDCVIGKCFISISNTKGARIKNVSVKNVFGLCIIAENNKNYHINNVNIQNALIGIYCTTNYDNNTYNCKGSISNVSFKNTKTFQTLGHSLKKTNGFSCLLLEYGVECISIKNIYCERAIERVGYLQSSKTTVSNIVAKNTGGVKLAGSWTEATQNVSGWIRDTHVDGVIITYDDPDITPVLLDTKLETYHSKNCSFNNVQFYGSPEIDGMTEFIRMRADVSDFIVDNVSISGFENASLTWGNDESQIIGVSPLYGKVILNNVRIRNIRAVNSFKGVKYIFSTDYIDSPEQIGEFHNVIVEDVYIDNPTNELNVKYICNENTKNVTFKRINTEHSFIEQTGGLFTNNQKYSLFDFSDSTDRGIILVNCKFR